MTQHDSDNIKFSYDQDNYALFIHRTLPDGKIETMNLDRHMTNLLLDSLLGIPEYQQWTAAKLIDKGLCRPNVP